jgi:hypothetical protein
MLHPGVLLGRINPLRKAILCRRRKIRKLADPLFSPKQRHPQTERIRPAQTTHSTRIKAGKRTIYVNTI